jgi:hypothetical protein
MASASPATASTQTARQGRDWLELLARIGYAARGVIYVVIGGLALLAALGQGGGTTGSKGAVRQVLTAPGGWILVLMVAVGLVGYSVWRFCQGVLDADSHGHDGKALAIRGGLIASGVTHFLLAIWAGKLALGQAVQSGGGSSKETVVAWLMSQPWGQWLVGIMGLILIGVGLAQFAKGHGEKYEKRFSWSQDKRRKLMPFCKFGLYARGVIFLIVGGFIVYAALTTNPLQAGGLAQALDWLRSQPFGPWLLGITAAGLISFGIYSFVEAVYRRIHPPA